MTTTNFLIPPPELVQKWWDNVPGTFTSLVDETELATQAAQWGADQELEACCQALYSRYVNTGLAAATAATVSQELRDWLRTTRRPKSPSLKERLSKAIIDGDERKALKLLEELDDSL